MMIDDTDKNRYNQIKDLAIDHKILPENIVSLIVHAQRDGRSVPHPKKKEEVLSI